jgi:predicted DNA-binding transcriptional regulator AlpA
MATIITKKEAARRGSMSVRHLERLASVGEGPAIIRLGVRKVGIADGDFDAWIASRRVLPPGHKA